jgi:hypothetical protein
MKRNIIKTAAQYMTDKNTHGYIEFYQMKMRDSFSKLLEIGAFQGQSLLMWKAIFPEAEIHTIDNFGDELSMPDFVKTLDVVLHEGDQTDVAFLSTIKDQFDVIIDDGDHRPAAQIQAFRHLFANNLASKGQYFIEDVYSNDEGWNVGVELTDRVMPAFENFIKHHNWGGCKFFPEHELSFWQSVIKKIEIWDDKLILIRKK